MTKFPKIYPERSQRAKLIFLAIILFGIFGLVQSSEAATYYVATTGSDTAGNGSSGAPWATIFKGISSMASGDTLIVKDGTYSGRANFIVNPPSGSAGVYTTIRAENPMAVRINRGADDLTYNERYIDIDAKNYIEVQGFVIDAAGDSTPPVVVRISGSNHVKVRKFIVKRSGEIDNYANIISVTGNSSYVLVEDVSLVGAMRYGFYVGGVSDASHHIIFRRCVGRADYSNSNQPISLFAVYGHNSDANLGSHDIAYQNCIAIDTNDINTSNPYKAMPWYFFKGQKNIYIDGSITLNSQTPSELGAIMQNSYGGTTINVTNSVFWRSNPNGVRIIGTDVNINQSTFGANTAKGIANGGSSPSTLRNSLIINNGTAADSGYTTAEYNSFSEETGFGTNNLAYQSDLLYILRVEPGSNRLAGGLFGSKVGAHIIKRIGADGSLWGEMDWNTEQSMDLWPFPYEAQIKSVFVENNDPSVGASPTINNTVRGFTNFGNGLYGGPITLTSYIWEYLGNQCPTNICGGGVTDTTPPAAPMGLVVQ